MADSVELSLTAGLPYSRRARVIGAANIWSAVDQFEVRSQVRAGKTESSLFLFDLRPYLTPTIDGEDIVIDLVLTGHDTRLVPKGYYDIIISDPGETDARALPVLSGKIKVNLLVTAATDE